MTQTDPQQFQLLLAQGIIKDLRKELQITQADYLQACMTIAAVVAATHGNADCGSKRGVVEDVESLRLEFERLYRLYEAELLEYRKLLTRFHKLQAATPSDHVMTDAEFDHFMHHNPGAKIIATSGETFPAVGAGVQ